MIAACHILSFSVTFSHVLCWCQVLATALLVAADVGCTEAARILLDKDCNVHARNHVDATALAIAADCNRIGMLTMLFEAGVDLEAGNQVRTHSPQQATR